MVSKELIQKSLNTAIIKCGPNLNTIHQNLSNMTQDEKNDLLKQISSTDQYDNYKKNLGELHEYNKLRKDVPSNSKIISEKIDENIDDLEDKIFQEERKIFETTNNKEDVDLSSFKEDEDNYSNDELYIGELEKEYTNLQNKNCDFSNEKEILDLYFGSDYTYINGMLYGDKNWKKLCKDYPNDKKYWMSRKKSIVTTMDRAIEKTPGLPHPTIVYKAGQISNRKKVGDTVKFKGYLSTTFAKGCAEERVKGYKDKVMIRFLLPAGTKGLARNAKGYLEKWEWDLEATARTEHELLLGRNKEGRIVNSPDGMLTVLLDG